VIASLSGALLEFDLVGDHLVEVVVDVHGVGYRVLLSSREGAALPPIGGAVALSIHTHVREGEITLYGFAGRAARRTFEILLGAHGVGPALALSILAVHGPDELREVIAAGDVDALCLVPGVGKKTAQRLALELSSRLDALGGARLGLATLAGSSGERIEVREALLALGYANEEVRDALQGLTGEGSVEELLREALRLLAPQR
jgi:Holliday junction DNA helicase RuvA